MGVIARRLQDSEEDWRHVYKSLLLLEFMSKHGPQKVLSIACTASNTLPFDSTVFGPTFGFLTVLMLVA